MIPEVPMRPVSAFSPEASFEWRADGTLYVQSPHPLGPYPEKLTEKLEYWCCVAPNRVFLAQRNSCGAWRHVTYAETLHRVRSIAQSLVERNLHAATPVVILSGNSIEHALLALACMYAGVPYAPISPSYSLGSAELTKLRYLWQQLEPRLVFAAEGAVFEKPLAGVVDKGTEVVTVSPPHSIKATPFSELENTRPGSSLERAHRQVTADTVAKVLFTSGSTGAPKGVVTTQRMLCSNQEMLRTVMPSLAEEPPILCDWLPWNHTFGGSHNFGIALYNGGTLYIDEGKPTASGFAATVKNLSEVATTAYFNVPRGYEMLVEALRRDAKFSRHFFSRVKFLFYAAAGLRQPIWNELRELALEACGETILMITGLGATESSAIALSTGIDGAAGHVGLPVPGLELKVVPTGNKLEARLRGPNLTPGFWRAPQLTAAAFDDQGFYKLGDAVAFIDPDNPSKGFCFDGRLDEDFKLSSGAWVSVGPLRNQFLAAFTGLVQDVVFAAPDREYVSALAFPVPGASEIAVRERLQSLANSATGNSTYVQRVLLVDSPPSFDAGELTEKGTLNQKAVWKHRANLVEELYAGSSRVIAIPRRASESNLLPESFT